ncbi:MAG: hypothetical protein IPL53_18540 [Ignavibacteria bacterium]|nr:hypothetical protein [Ignavibacteria bacterium]
MGNGSLKEVYHTTDELYKLRKLVSAYEDFVTASVRMKNQRSSMFLSEGKITKRECTSGNAINKFITEKQNLTIEHVAHIRKNSSSCLAKYQRRR